MSGAVLWVVPAIAVVAVLVLGGDDTTDSVLVVLLGAAGGVALWSLGNARARALARRARELAPGAHSTPFEPTGGAAWSDLVTAVEAIAVQLRDARHELRSLVPWTDRLVTALTDPALVFDAERRVVAANQAAISVLGLPTSGDPLTTLSALGSAAAAAAVEEAVDVGRTVSVDVDRGDRELRVTASPLDEHVLVVVSDRTRERQVEEMRRDFVTNASHELKTPVAAITSLAEALRVAPPDRHAPLVERLDEETTRLTRLVRDLLDLRRLDDGGGGVEAQPVDLAVLVGAAVDAHGAAADERGVTITADVPGSAVVVGVERELRLVVDNLVANAVQYNRPGGTVEIELRPNGGEHVLVVRDTGIGIPQQSLPRVFEWFYRVDVARSRQHGGTGLGLSLVRNAVERHRGRVSIESLLGVGTTVTVRLPVSP